MKLVTFSARGGSPSSGALIDDDRNVVDLVAAGKAKGRGGERIATVLAIAEGGQGALDEAYDAIKGAAKDAIHARDAVKLYAPIPYPPQMRDFLCFEKHLKQAFAQARKVRAQQSPDPAAAMKEMEEKNILSVPQAWYERPLHYHPNRLNVIGDGDEVVWPAYSQLMDFELEFGFYIGKPGRDISKEKAREHIFGYTIFNDFSARDEQTREMPGQLGPGKGKDFDGGNSMGPCLVTADEIKDPYKLTMVCRVNGEEWGRGNSSEMGWKFEDCIAHASRSETLHSGEFFGSGTVGNGCGLEQMRFLKSGDVVELEVEGIGTLRNRVVRN
jgi:2-keto-4-pentenoate hydratase/2-oxohepta-3-ene-1,7-dioic acid hydratase in catechol pathway